jgi:hypothetical protein
MFKEQTYSVLARAVSGISAPAIELCSCPSAARIMAAPILAAFTLPILTFTPSLKMNGINSAAKQLSRKMFRGPEPLPVRSPVHASTPNFHGDTSAVDCRTIPSMKAPVLACIGQENHHPRVNTANAACPCQSTADRPHSPPQPQQVRTAPSAPGPIDT